MKNFELWAAVGIAVAFLGALICTLFVVVGVNSGNAADSTFSTIAQPSWESPDTGGDPSVYQTPNNSCNGPNCPY